MVAEVVTSRKQTMQIMGSYECKQHVTVGTMTYVMELHDPARALTRLNFFSHATS